MSEDVVVPATLRGRWRLRLVVGATLLGLMAGVGGWLAVRDREGPLHYPYAGQDTIGFVNVEAGSVLTFGAVYVLNSGDADLVLRSAELLGGDASVARVSPPSPQGPTGGSVGWPPGEGSGLPTLTSACRCNPSTAR